MSILSGFFKTIKYRMTDQGYKWQSEKTSSQTVVMGDGTDNTDTAEKRFGAIKGLTSSTSVTDTGYALDATIGKKHEDSIAALNQSLDRIKFIYSGTPTKEIDISTALNYRYILILMQTGNQSNYYKYYSPQLIPINFIKRMSPNPTYFTTPVDANVWYNNALYIKTNSSSDTNRYQVYGVN